MTRIKSGFLSASSAVELSYGVGVAEGFSIGGLVADGTGGGAVSGTTLLVGSGNAGAFRLLFTLLLLLLLLLLFSFAFTVGLTSSIGAGDTVTFAFGLAFTFADGLIVPPDGNPSSGFPVAGCEGCTGWLFGSAASVCGCV